LCFTAGMARKSPAAGKVTAGLQRLLKHGLPATPANTDRALLDLDGIIMRAADPFDETSRAAALNDTLLTVLARFPDLHYAPAVRALFGLAPAEQGQHLALRRELAAEQAGHEVRHFRRRVEPQLIEQIADELLADADHFARSPMFAPRLAPITARKPLPADPFAWEDAEHEEQLNRMWSAIYAARAELLAVERLISMRADLIDIVATAVNAAWRWATARAEAIGYSTAFAPELESSVDELLALAGWVPPLTAAQAARLTEAAADGASRDQFTEAMHGEIGLGEIWVNRFLTRHTESGDAEVALEQNT
jgi:hypothetical protein